MNKTTCPLDCYDACSVIYKDKKLYGDKSHPITKGYLCPNLNGFLDEERIVKARFDSKEIDMSTALDILTRELKGAFGKSSIYFKGHGNFGRLQDAPVHFFSKYGSYFTKGSLCDGAGEAGVIAGRGESLLLPYEQIEKSSVVVVWGRNVSVTNSHMTEILKDKILIVIDPVKTSIAKKAAIHLQIKPREDFALALLFARFAYIEQMEDYDFIDNFTNDFDYFVDFFRSFTIKSLSERVGVELGDVLTALMLMHKERVSFLVGVGVQKYAHGYSVLRAIDSFAAMMGFFAKEGCGVSYLANSSLGFKNVFKKEGKKVCISDVDFSKYDLAFIQGTNPANQMPNSKRVIESLKKCKFKVYFGLYDNETAKLCDLVIPAKNFLEKDDIRFSYGSDFIGLMPKLIDSDIGISEIELTNKLCEEFGYEKLPSKKVIIEEIVGDNVYEKEGFLRSKEYQVVPYSNGFYTDDEKFNFLDEFDDEICQEEGFYLITPKYRRSLNSQFKRDSFIYLSPSSGFRDGEEVEASSIYGEYRFAVKIDENLRSDCVKIYSGTKGVNFLTPHKPSLEGDSAIYQDVKIIVKRVGI